MRSSVNQKFKPILMICITFLILTSLRLIWLVYHAPPEQPLAHHGVLDLRSYELKDDKTITLNGEWQFIPEVLVDPSSTMRNVSNVKSEWSLVPNKKNVPYTFGSYHLRVLLKPDQKQTYGIRIPTAKTASKLFVNGQLVNQSGRVANNKESHKGLDMPYTAFFEANKNEIDIVLQVSNFDTDENVKIAKSITFGSTKAISGAEQLDQTLVTFIITAFVLQSLYTILVYLFVYRRKVVLFFTSGLLFMSLRWLMDSREFIAWLHIDYNWYVKLDHITYLVSAFFFVQFMRYLLTENQSAKIFRWCTTIYFLCIFYILFSPIKYVLLVDTIFYGFYLCSFITAIFFALEEYYQKLEGVYFLVFSAVSSMSMFIWIVIKSIASIEIPFYPFDYLLAFLGFAGFWFKHFSKTRDQVNELVDELRKANKQKDEFLENSSQKLWSPLNEMITVTQTIFDSKDGSLAPKQKDDLKLIINIGRGMAFVLRDILDFTRLKENTLQLEFKSVNVRAVISAIFDILKFMADGKQIQFASAIPHSFPNVIADEKQLIQILFNLLYTSVKYTNGKLIVVEAQFSDGIASIYIKDSGLTIDEKTQKRVLASNDQEDLIITAKDIELGLSVCRKLIELHGGTLQIDTVSNQGTAFIFTLPLAEEPVSEMEKIEVERVELSVDQIASHSEQREKQFMILAVDDDPVQLRVIANIFSDEQYEVISVANGEEALSYLNIMEWDLVIIDAIMPDMSGYELTQSIRKHYSILELPILLLTARNYPEDVYTGFALGVNDYVTKPINSLELKSRGQALIDLKHSISERLQMEAAWLQAQIQPHFFYNTLNTIASLSEIDSSRMVRLLDEFGNYLQGSFDTENLQRVVPLEHELDLVRSYLYIEKERFGERLQIEWEIDENLMIEIPPLTIQPLVENAIRHGVLKKASGGTVCIRITDLGNCVQIAIIDNGIGMDEAKLKQVLDEKNETGRGIGVINTNRRLKRIYGRGLQVTSSPGQGTEAMFEVPK